MPLETNLGPNEEEQVLLKKKFRELDANRDGMLNMSEFANLLRQKGNEFDDGELQMLFFKVDKDKTGKIHFDEFVDYIFGLSTKREVTKKQQVAMQAVRCSQEMWAEVFQVELRGCVMHPQCEGLYEKGDEVNGHACYELGYPQSTLFYGWTQDRKKVGWFMARIPPRGGAVQRYKMFNPSPEATAPHLCCAVWELPDGRRDKRMFVTGVTKEIFDDECTEGTALADELWEGLPEGYESDDEYGGWETGGAAADEEEAWEMEWIEEAGEGVADTDDADESAYTGDVDAADLGREDTVALFEDEAFPPCPTSLGRAAAGARRTPKGAVQATGWKRLQEVHDSPCLFRNIVSEDVLGAEAEGNRWFLCACATVAEYPAWISSMFGSTKKLSRSGRYLIRLYHPGKKAFMKIEIDDFVPMNNETIAYAGVSFEGEIWPALIEKGLAKLCGSYKNMEYGSVAYGLLYLCGGGSSEVWAKGKSGRWAHSYTVWKGKMNDNIERKRAEAMVNDGVDIDEEKLWTTLRSYMEHCYPVACSIDKASEADTGLDCDWTYTLIGAREVFCEGQTLRMCRMRNPFQAGRWTGRWNDDSEAWEQCPVAKNSLRFTPRHDGTFWMSYADFLQYFVQVDCVTKAMPVQGCRPSKIAGLMRGLAKYEPTQY